MTTGSSTISFLPELRSYCSLPALDAALRRQPGRSRGRQHRRQRRGLPPHHRGVPAERSATAQPGLGREDLEQVFHDYLGIDRVLWMDRGIAGDDTHGHIDDIARFVARDTIVTVTEPNTAG